MKRVWKKSMSAVLAAAMFATVLQSAPEQAAAKEAEYGVYEMVAPVYEDHKIAISGDGIGIEIERKLPQNQNTFVLMDTTGKTTKYTEDGELSRICVPVTKQCLYDDIFAENKQFITVW